jgi:hypothetical protein
MRVVALLVQALPGAELVVVAVAQYRYGYTIMK